jgi:type I restriction enzyme, S subunit
MMPDGWCPTGLADVVTLQRGFDLPTQARHPGRVPILGSFGITGSHDQAPVRGPGVTIGRSGASIGVATYSAVDFWPLNTALYVKDFHENDPLWVYWLLHSIDFTGYNSGSAQPSLNRNFLTQIPINLPPVEEQSRIADVLGTLDDLIFVNRMLSHRAQLLAAALASTSPDQVALTDLASVADVRQFRPDGLVDHFSIPAFDEGKFPMRVEGESIKSGKLLLAEPTVLVSRLNPQTPRVWMAYPSDVPAAASTEFVPLVGADSVGVEEIWAVCASDQFARQMRARVTGTTGSHQRVDKAAIPGLVVADIRKLDRRARMAIISLAREAAASLVSASEATHVRDELLPLLLSGRVRVGDAAA